MTIVPKIEVFEVCEYTFSLTYFHTHNFIFFLLALVLYHLHENMSFDALFINLTQINPVAYFKKVSTVSVFKDRLLSF